MYALGILTLELSGAARDPGSSNLGSSWHLTGAAISARQFAGSPWAGRFLIIQHTIVLLPYVSLLSFCFLFLLIFSTCVLPLISNYCYVPFACPLSQDCILCCSNLTLALTLQYCDPLTSFYLIQSR